MLYDWSFAFHHDWAHQGKDHVILGFDLEALFLVHHIVTLLLLYQRSGVCMAIYH